MAKKEEIDWDRLTELDRKYITHTYSSEPEWMPLPVSEAKGVYFRTPWGEVIDATSQVYCVNMGHNHPKIVKAIREQAKKLCYVCTGFISEHRPMVAKLIIEDCIKDEWAGRVSFDSSGSEAVERAVVQAKLYTNRPYIITRDNAFHGRTGQAAACTRILHMKGILSSPTDKKDVRQVPYFPSEGFFLAPSPFCYRCTIGHTYPDCKGKGKLPCVKRTEDIILSLGPDRVAGIITEIILGTGGNIPPPPEYIPQLRELTKEMGLLWVDDEVICGFGRTGKWFAYQHWDVEPDIMVFAKGVTSAHLPVAGTVVSKDIAKMMGNKRFFIGGTYDAHPICMAAARANIEAMIEENVVENSAKMGKYMGDKLKKLEDNHKCVGIVQGMGLLWGIELVKNKETREPFIKEDRQFNFAGDLSKVPVSILLQRCIVRGLFFVPFLPNTVTVAPPLIIKEEEIDKIVDILDDELKEIDKMCE